MSDTPPTGDSGSPNNPYSPASGSGTATIDDEIVFSPSQTRGMTGQAVVVGVLMIVQGAFDLIAAAGAGFYAWFMPQMFEQIQKQQAAGGGGAAPMPAEMPAMLSLGFGVGAAGLLIIGAVLVYAGIGVIRYQRRTPAIVALSLGMLTLFTCYCFPTSLALGIYGLIFLLNQPVASAFQLRSQGYSVKRIQQAFLSLP